MPGQAIRLADGSSVRRSEREAPVLERVIGGLGEDLPKRRIHRCARSSTPQENVAPVCSSTVAVNPGVPSSQVIAPIGTAVHAPEPGLPSGVQLPLSEAPVNRDRDRPVSYRNSTLVDVTAHLQRVAGVFNTTDPPSKR